MFRDGLRLAVAAPGEEAQALPQRGALRSRRRPVQGEADPADLRRDGGRFVRRPRGEGASRMPAFPLVVHGSFSWPRAGERHDANKSGPRGVRGVIELAGEYVEGLREIVRDADRQRLFEARTAGTLQ